jgi:hypothetical protein
MSHSMYVFSIDQSIYFSQTTSSDKNKKACRGFPGQALSLRCEPVSGFAVYLIIELVIYVGVFVESFNAWNPSKDSLGLRETIRRVGTDTQLAMVHPYYNLAGSRSL